MIAALLMSMLLGMAYIQIVRQDRASTERFRRAQSLQQATDATLDAISSRLKNDLGITESGMFFGDPDGDGTPQEPYDYPGERDEWLASTRPPETSDGTGLQTWPQVSLLGEQFMTGGDTQRNTVEPQPTDQIADTRPLGTGLADADGDGIVDAKWERAPIENTAGRAYFVAVRIIDNSSMINANTALSQVNGNGDFDATADGRNAPRWWYPSELDLGGFLYSFPSRPMTQLEDFLSYRLNRDDLDLTSSASRPPVRWTQRGAFWLNAASMYGDYGFNPLSSMPYHKIAIDSELDLRLRNGLNSGAISSTIERASDSHYEIDTNGDGNPDNPDDLDQRPDGMPQFLRSEMLAGFGGDERNFRDALRNMNVPQSDRTPAMYFRSEPRHQITVRSGHSIFAPTFESDPSHLIKADLNRFIRGEDTAALSSVVEQVYGPDVGQAPAPNSNAWPATLDTNSWTQAELARELGDQFAANVMDYVDQDNVLTSEGLANPEPRYGLEALPFITEAFVQYDYQVTSSTPNMGGFDVTFDKQGHGFLVELRNPFPKPISLENVALRIGGSQVTLTDLSWSDDQGNNIDLANQRLGPGEYAIIYNNTGSGSPNENIPATHKLTNDNGGENNTTDPSDAHWLATWGSSPFDSSTDSTVDVELLPTIDDGGNGTLATFAYQSVPALNPDHDDSITATAWSPPSGNDPKDEYFYRHAATIGNGSGINALALPGDEWNTGKNYAGSLPAPYNAQNDEIGYADKNDTAAGDLGPDDVLPAENNQIVLRDGLRNGGDEQFLHVGEIAHIALLGPNPDNGETIPDAWRNADDVRKHTLNFRTTNAPLVGSGNKAVPHAVMLMSRLTTLSPAEDVTDGGQPLDNDGDGKANANDPDEQFIPGTINVNTAPRDLLLSALPIPADLNMPGQWALRPYVVDAILGYRDDPGNRPNNHRPGGARKGIAYLGEMMNVFNTNNDGDPSSPNSFPNNPFTNQITYTGANGSNSYDGQGDTHSISVNGSATKVDFLSNPDQTQPDEIADDREEQTMLMRWLSQVCSTRSDVFTAYVLVRAQDVNTGENPTQKRLIAVFDRSRITDADDEVEILGIHEY